MPTDLTLDFSAAISGSLLDKDLEGTGFSSVQANSTGNPYDLGRIDLNTSTSSLILTATQGSNTDVNTLKNALETGIDAVTQPFTISSRLQGPFTNLTTAAQQGGIFFGPNQDNYVKLVIINNGTKGLGLQFFEEQNGVSASVGGGSEPQIIGLEGTGINTLDLFLNGDPLTGIITAAYRINSDTTTPTPFSQELTPSSFATFFTDAATARAGILAFTKDAADTTVTFDSFSVKPALNLSAFTTISWSPGVAPSPIGRSEAQSAVVDGKIYVFGGYTDTSFIPKTKRTDVYDPVNNTWQQLTDAPKPITHAGTAVAGRDIYLAGGLVGTATGTEINAVRDVWKYNVDTNEWSAMPKLPQPRHAGELSFLNGELHFFGGTGSNREVSQNNHWILPLDGGTNWAQAAPLPNPRNHLGDAVIGGKIYAIGGQHGNEGTSLTQNSVHVWDPALPNTWTAVASMPQGLSHIAGATFEMGNRIIVAGGQEVHSSSISDVIAYNPLSNSWTPLTSLPTARHSGIGEAIGNQIFYLTGAKGFPLSNYTGLPL